MRRILAIFMILGFLALPVRAAEPKKYVALTFDDGPSGIFTEKLLEGLAFRGAKATFFLCGYRIRQYPELIGSILSQGHEIGLHGYSHDNLALMSRREIARELEMTRVLLPEGCRIRFLRAPGGCTSLAVTQVAGAMGLAVLDWSVDPRDWATRDSAAVCCTILDRVRDGDIILMHDMSESSVRAALNAVDLLTKEGFRFVTVSELARLRSVRVRSGACYRCFPPES